LNNSKIFFDYSSFGRCKLELLWKTFVFFKFIPYLSAQMLFKLDGSRFHVRFFKFKVVGLAAGARFYNSRRPVRPVTALSSLRAECYSALCA
jgi:hypothetical protein